MYIIGISGGSASGKSTLSKILFDNLTGYKTMIFSSDKYLKIRSRS